MTIEEYYKYYLSLHQNKYCRRLHFLGQWVTIIFTIAIFYKWYWWFIPIVPFIIYPFAWSGHYFFEKNIKDTALDHILRTVSRIEALIHDNTVMTLTDSSNAYNCRLDTTTLNSDEEEEAYIVEWSWKGQHTGNIR